MDMSFDVNSSSTHAIRQIERCQHTGILAIQEDKHISLHDPKALKTVFEHDPAQNQDLLKRRLPLKSVLKPRTDTEKFTTCAFHPVD
jgi:hypothetical protein